MNELVLNDKKTSLELDEEELKIQAFIEKDEVKNEKINYLNIF